MFRLICCTVESFNSWLLYGPPYLTHGNDPLSEMYLDTDALSRDVWPNYHTGRKKGQESQRNPSAVPRAKFHTTGSVEPELWTFLSQFCPAVSGRSYIGGREHIYKYIHVHTQENARKCLSLAG